tara:strand:+ start:614 stop:2215 length:1602 start_codon:yes stop_codon:yes gene_type:complete
MKNSSNLLLLIVFSLFTSVSYSQLNYSTDFENAPDRALWSFGNTTSNACSGNSEFDNAWSGAATVSMTNSTSLGNSSGCVATVQFDYKVVDWNTNTAATASDLNTLIVYSGATASGPWTAVYTLPSHASSNTCATKSFTYNHPVGATFLKFEATWTAGDWEIFFDNISIIEDRPQVTITKTCSSDLTSYSLDVQVTDLGTAASVDITDGTTTFQTNVGLGTYTISGLTAATTIFVTDHFGSCGYSEVIPMCDICTDSPSLPSDECATAPLIDLSQQFAGSTNCAYTVSAGSPGGCGSMDNDSWISFIAADTDVEIDYTIGDCQNDDGIQLSVFSGACSSLSLLPGSCVNPTGELLTGTWNFSGLTVGNTYYIRIDGYAGDLCDYSFTPISGVVVTPPNDSCATAIVLTCGATHTNNTILATDEDAPTACSGGGGTSKGVWYSFIGTGQSVTISTDASATNFDTEINIYEGTCTSLTCIAGDDDSGSGTTSEHTFTTTNAVEYFVYVDGKGAAEGQFEISLTCSSCAANAGTWN